MILLTFTKKKMSDIVVKYNRLNKTARQEVIDFMDFLLSKQKISKSNFLTPYKNKILNVSNWTDADLKIFDENQKLFNQWRVQEWKSIQVFLLNS